LAAYLENERYPHCSVLVSVKTGYERDFTIELLKSVQTNTY